MLNKRQKDIINYLVKNKGEYIKTSYFADEYAVSVRTIQNDIKAIKEDSVNYENSYEILNKIPDGTKIKIVDENAFKRSFLNPSDQNPDNSLNYKINRINKLLCYLLSQHKSVSLNNCADYVYVSKSTIFLDLKEVDSIVSNYSLNLVQSKGYVWIDGRERDKRMCLIDNDAFHFEIIPSDSIRKHKDVDDTKTIKKTFIDVLLEKHYSVSENEFQNLLLWINASVRRMQDYFYLNQDDINISSDISNESIIAKEIYKRLKKHFNITVPEIEVEFLAMYLFNRGTFNDKKVASVSADLTNFISESLEEIKNVFPSNFLDDVDLRISLTMHCVPLLSRVRNNVQLKNKMMSYVKQNFQYAYDIATYFAFLFSKKFDCKLSEEETSFIAIYFNRSLMQHYSSAEKKRVCVVTTLTRSAYFLLEQFLYNKFDKYISTISFMSPQEVEEIDLEQYDVYFSTEDSRIVEFGLATKINCFPDETDYEIIKGRIEGYGSEDGAISFFDQRLFFIDDFKSKKDIQKRLVEKATKIFNLENLSKEIELREEFGSTYFGNGVAILHPMHSMSKVSFIGEALLENPIVWDSEGNKVNIVFIVCLQKDNFSAFQMWDYISPIIFDQTFKKRLANVSNYEDFTSLMKEFLKNKV